MNPVIKNTIILGAAAVVLILGYMLFVKKSPDQTGLISTSPSPSGVIDPGDNLNQGSIVANDFLSLLLGVKNIKLNSTIFSSPAFTSLHDSSIVLVPDGTEGRPNPFAPIGFDGTESTNPVSLPDSEPPSLPAPTL